MGEFMCSKSFFNKFYFSISVLLAVFYICLACQNSASVSSAQTDETQTNIQLKKYPLVLIHGLSNMHKWSNDFLDECLKVFGSKRVFVVFSDKTKNITTTEINGRTVIYCGENGYLNAGIDSIEKQNFLIKEKIFVLKKYGLTGRFNIIAHSMGGLISRRLIQDLPGKITSLVTLGTPHHGSPLADSFKWVGLFVGAGDAIEDLKPKNCLIFNNKYPVEKAPLAEKGKIYTITGNTDGKKFGFLGEVALGYQILKNYYNTDNDGLVPVASSHINGAIELAFFNELDHYALVRERKVAFTACKVLN